jgi:hypothetical protein
MTARRGRDPLSVLDVVDRLTVGPTVVEPDRIRTGYAVTVRGTTSRTALTCKFEEPVLAPADPAARNLAALIGAQPALNYGLFCREIVFDDPFDDRDIRFLEEFARNTAREIYVNKLLRPNPFIVADVGGLPADPGIEFLRARLRFPRIVKAPGRTKRAPLVPGRVAVLSSGGKDSLATFGMAEELGLDVHPIYVNESGRHWLTALNAYRHFQAGAPDTARVWTDADRLFNWMLRHLPLVRPDFQSVRADIYPLRLWTVAVFLFSALPVLRDRGIGRLLIGDEFDTTARARHRGIPHYAGLYDQSRWFDAAMTRYFAGKGFGIDVFSILRPASEILIEKLLAERYPALLAHQVSCHAAHVEGDRVRPCGRCEKCRRIVGMLVALGADPGACGYSREQTAAALEAVARLGVHQERPGAEHLLHLLSRSGRLPDGGPGAPIGRPRPEVMSLRFHPVASPIETIPADLRGPLHRIWLQHADGALQRRAGRWVELPGFFLTEPLDSPEFSPSKPGFDLEQRFV